MDRYITQAVCVLSYERDKTMRHKAAAAEKTFARIFSKQSQQTNVPDDFDPAAPRIVFVDAHKQMTISQVAVQLTLSFGKDQRNAIAECLKIMEKHFHQLFLAFDKFLGKGKIRETAAIVSLNYPSTEPQSTMHKYLHDRFIKVEPLGDLASINIQIGYRTPDDFFLNMAASVYELRGKDFSPPMLVDKPLVFDVMEFPILEKGYGLKIDINTRPQNLRKKYDAMQDPRPLLAKLRNSVEVEADSFLGLVSQAVPPKVVRKKG